MMPVLPFLILTPEQADDLAQMTAGEENQILARPIDGGEHAGMRALPTRVRSDPSYAGEGFQAVFAVLSEVELDTAVAWPAVEE
jgi:hypothetical protein